MKGHTHEISCLISINPIDISSRFYGRGVYKGHQYIVDTAELSLLVDGNQKFCLLILVGGVE